MSVEITVPSAGESVSSGILAAWLKEDGEAVSEGDELFELETDKATLAVPSPASGTLKQKAKEGDEVTVGSVVGEIVADGGGSEAGHGTGKQSEPSPAEAAQPAPREHSNGTGEAVALSPAVRRMVEEYDLDAQSIRGTGKGGRITKKDVQDKLDEPGAQAVKAAPAEAEGTAQGSTPPPAPAPASAPAPALQAEGKEAPQHPAPPVGGRPLAERQKRVPMSTIRRRIAENLVQSRREAAHLTTFNEVDMSGVMALRSTYRESFESKHGVRLGFMSFFVKASCEALKELPEVNAFLEGEEIVYNNFYDIGVAVSSDRGLVVPVLRDADTMSFAEIERQVADKAKRVRERRMTIDELTGGTFTITNGGVFGSLLSTPIPNFPQSAILGMHTIQKRPVAVNDEVVIRPMMYLALTYDHRIVDGRGAVTFLVRIKEYIENPERLLLEV